MPELAQNPLFTGRRGATFSPCRRYRFDLWRTWDPGRPTLLWIMLNPSTADAYKNDPTVGGCQSWSNSWGYGRMVVVNLFAWRATDPDEMKSQEAPTGGLWNDAAIMGHAGQSGKIICAWGNDGAHMGRSARVTSMLRRNGHDLWAMTLTGGGHPGHPLYLKDETEPFLWKGQTEA